MSYRVDFDKYTNIISHGEQNVTMTSKVRGQGHIAQMHENHDISQSIGHRDLILTRTCTLT